MKQLIRLSVKYIRRQKLRTFLTFLSIMLAAFMLTSFITFVESIRQGLICINNRAEVDVSEILEKSPKDNADEILKNHAVVDKYYIEKSQNTNRTVYEMIRDDNGRFTYMTLSMNNDESIPVATFSQKMSSGDPVLGYSYGYNSKELPAGHVMVPFWVKEMGYQEGDKVTFTLNICTASIDPDSSQIQKAVENLKNDPEFNYYIKDGDELPAEKTIKNEISLMRALKKLYSFDEIELTDEKTEKTVSFTAVIDGFKIDYSMNDNEYRFYFYSSYSDGLLTFPGLEEYFTQYTYAGINTTDKINFDDALKTLFVDMGFDEADFNDYFNKRIYNEGLLGAKLKGSRAVLYFFVPIVISLLLLLLIWFAARFIIDNAFEISVHERSKQFAALRILGASKPQLFVLVLTEAFIYCLTAVPLGTGLAVLFSRSVAETFIKSIAQADFSVHINPLLLIVPVLLIVIGVLISTYTSAMWASRRLSPLEAMQYGKPKSKKIKRVKTKRFKSVRSFLYYYTRQNIRRTGSKYIVSTIAIALSVMLFTGSFTALLSARKNMNYNSFCEVSPSGKVEYVFYPKEEYIYDYGLENAGMLSLSDVELAKSIFDNSDAVNMDYDVKILDNIDMDIINTLNIPVKADPIQSRNNKRQCMIFINEEQYVKYYQSASGMTYSQFVSSGGAVVSFSLKNSYYFLGSDFDSEWEKAEKDVIYRYQSKDIPIIAVNNENISSDCSINLIMPCESLEDFDFQYGETFNLYLRVKDTEHNQKCREMINEFQSKCSTMYILADRYHLLTGRSDLESAVISATFIILFCIWFIGILSMISAINASVINRQNELLIMRSVGMTMKQMYRNVFLESVLFTVGSDAFGVIIGAAANIIMLGVMKNVKGLSVLEIIITGLIIFAVNLIISLIAAIPGVQHLWKMEKNTEK